MALQAGEPVADPSLFQRVLGPAWEQLHPALQRFHSLRGRHVLQGEVCTEPATHGLGRMLGWLMRLQRTAQTGALRFVLEAQPLEERWTRFFPHTTMASTMALRSEGIAERFGLATFHFSLVAEGDALVFRYDRLQVLGLPWPLAWAPAVAAREHGDGDRLHFDVEARLPWIGRVVRYAGWLAVPGRGGAAPTA